MEIVRFIHSEPQANIGIDLEGTLRSPFQPDLSFGYGRHPGSKAGIPTNGPELRRLRLTNHLSQQKLADQVGISKGFVSLMETKGRPVSRFILDQLAGVLRVEPEVLQSDAQWLEQLPEEGSSNNGGDILTKAVRSVTRALNAVDLNSRDPKLMAQELQVLLTAGNKLAVAIEMKSSPQE